MLIESLGIFSIVGFIATLIHVYRTPVIKDLAPFTTRPQRHMGFGWTSVVEALFNISGVLLALFSFLGLGWLVLRLCVGLVEPASLPTKCKSEVTERRQRRPLVIDVRRGRIHSEPTTKTINAEATSAERTLTTSCPDSNPLFDNREDHSASSSHHDSTLDSEVDPGTAMSLDGVAESGPAETCTLPVQSEHNQQLFVPEIVSDSPLTVEDIYIEAMTLDAEIRVFRRNLDAAGRRELSQIINFCRDALHRKLLLRSVEQAQGGLGAGPSRRRCVSSENLASLLGDSTRTLELIAETAV